MWVCVLWTLVPLVDFLENHMMRVCVKVCVCVPG